ncbi:hypothetical protein BB559_004512 [Furculomyces boomerangus]|uniref:AB hydrolase-1 domain-containing protein n=1 Tax=Furculomyces boomerangus TaxID=61424 RepID=A0A2T9YED4_9FUNG|nr:hypothetical protein BB559_004512 [Furculomyces boomerangus]
MELIKNSFQKLENSSTNSSKDKSPPLASIVDKNNHPYLNELVSKDIEQVYLNPEKTNIGSQIIEHNSNSEKLSPKLPKPDLPKLVTVALVRKPTISSAPLRAQNTKSNTDYLLSHTNKPGSPIGNSTTCLTNSVFSKFIPSHFNVKTTSSNNAEKRYQEVKQKQCKKNSRSYLAKVINEWLHSEKKCSKGLLDVSRGSNSKNKGVRIYYELYGTGPNKIFFIMGMLSTAEYWKLQIQHFARNPEYQICIFDNRGSGRSTLGDGNFSISDMAKDALMLLNHIGWKNGAHIIGVSLGGMIAQRMCLLTQHSTQNIKTNQTTFPIYQKFTKGTENIVPKNASMSNLNDQKKDDHPSNCVHEAPNLNEDGSKDSINSHETESNLSEPPQTSKEKNINTIIENKSNQINLSTEDTLIETQKTPEISEETYFDYKSIDSDISLSESKYIFKTQSEKERTNFFFKTVTLVDTFQSSVGIIPTKKEMSFFLNGMSFFGGDLKPLLTMVFSNRWLQRKFDFKKYIPESDKYEIENLQFSNKQVLETVFKVINKNIQRSRTEYAKRNCGQVLKYKSSVIKPKPFKSLPEMKKPPPTDFISDTHTSEKPSEHSQKSAMLPDINRPLLKKNKSVPVAKSEYESQTKNTFLPRTKMIPNKKTTELDEESIVTFSGSGDMINDSLETIESSRLSPHTKVHSNTFRNNEITSDIVHNDEKTLPSFRDNFFCKTMTGKLNGNLTSLFGIFSDSSNSQKKINEKENKNPISNEHDSTLQVPTQDPGKGFVLDSESSTDGISRNSECDICPGDSLATSVKRVDSNFHLTPEKVSTLNSIKQHAGNVRQFGAVMRHNISNSQLKSLRKRHPNSRFLVIHGGNDHVIRPSNGKNIAKNLKCHYAIIENAGHMSMLDAPVTFNTILESFILNSEWLKDFPFQNQTLLELEGNDPNYIEKADSKGSDTRNTEFNQWDIDENTISSRHKGANISNSINPESSSSSRTNTMPKNTEDKNDVRGPENLTDSTSLNQLNLDKRKKNINMTLNKLSNETLKEPQTDEESPKENPTTNPIKLLEKGDDPLNNEIEIYLHGDTPNCEKVVAEMEHKPSMENNLSELNIKENHVLTIKKSKTEIPKTHTREEEMIEDQKDNSMMELIEKSGGSGKSLKKNNFNRTSLMNFVNLDLKGQIMKLFPSKSFGRTSNSTEKISSPKHEKYKTVPFFLSSSRQSSPEKIDDSVFSDYINSPALQLDNHRTFSLPGSTMMFGNVKYKVVRLDPKKAGLELDNTLRVVKFGNN